MRRYIRTARGAKTSIIPPKGHHCQLGMLHRPRLAAPTPKSVGFWGSGCAGRRAREVPCRSAWGSTVRRKLRGVSKQPASEAVPVLEELARDQHARPVRDIEELRADVWFSDKELDEFLANWRASSDTSLS